MKKKPFTIIVGGFLGFFHSGGAVWDYIQYPLGLHLMGYDVYYIEDTRLYPIYCTDWQDSSATIVRLKTIMEYFGLQDRWIYRDELTNSFYGRPVSEYDEICKRADIFINISCANVMREEYYRIPVRILIDTDPMFTQIQMVTAQSFTSEESSLGRLASLHNYHFTFGENINSNDCLIPVTSCTWKITRQPVCLNFWSNNFDVAKKAAFTTLMNWKSGKPLTYNGMTWGQKDVTFPVILKIPESIPVENFKVAINEMQGGQLDPEMKPLKEAKWNVISSQEASRDHKVYQSFIYQSKAEISVAKETYVKANTGWFSCRSACYLAAGRPVITQDTGWSSFYPVGRGLFPFKDQKEAIEAVCEVSANWKIHSLAAREIAEAYFDYSVILTKMLNSI